MGHPSVLSFLAASHAVLVYTVHLFPVVETSSQVPMLDALDIRN
jgi:hypothetical protein